MQHLMKQTTYLSKGLIKQINKELHGKHLHSLGTTISSGVSFVINNSLDFNDFCDEERRIFIINMNIQDEIFTLENLYAPKASQWFQQLINAQYTWK